jgi:acetyl esterase/lipase
MKGFTHTMRFVFGGHVIKEIKLKYKHMRLIVICLLLVFCAAFVEGQDSYQLVFAKREFMRVDKNGDDVLEKSEVKNRWNEFKVFDSDGDDLVTLEEYSKIDIPYLETGSERKLNIKYKSTPQEDLYLDIYYPSKQFTSKALPVVVYVHGGGWFNGSKENITKGLVKETFQKLVQQGFVVVSVNYRLTRFKSVLMRDCVVDVMDAVRYLSKNNSDLGIDANRVYVLGDSAGGQLAQMITLADPSDFPGDSVLFNYQYKVAAGVSWYGPSDFTQLKLFETPDSTKNPDRFGGRIVKQGSSSAEKDALYKEMSPIFYLTAQSPPLYMMAAEDDTTIPVAHAYHMKKKADEIGAKVDLFVAKNAGHNWRNVDGEINPSTDVIMQKTIDFFMRYK